MARHDGELPVRRTRGRVAPINSQNPTPNNYQNDSALPRLRGIFRPFDTSYEKITDRIAAYAAADQASDIGSGGWSSIVCVPQ